MPLALLHLDTKSKHNFMKKYGMLYKIFDVCF